MQKVIVKAPVGHEFEKSYVFSQIFSNFIRLDFELVFCENLKNYNIYVGEKEVQIPDTFFGTIVDGETYIDAKYLPCNFCRMRYEENELVVFYGNPEIVEELNKTTFHFDIVGIIFFMLSRWEESIYSKNSFDEHGRFKGKASHAFKNGYLEEPVVDILWTLLIKKMGIDFKKNISQKITLTHDVDIPLKYLTRKSLIISALGSILRGKFSLAVNKILESIFYNFNYFNDPYDLYSYYMDQAEKYGLKAHFYFMHKGDHTLDFPYDINNKKIKMIINKIKLRGHSIGYHASYNSSTNSDLFKYEVYEIEKVTGLKLKTGRQHFLRCKFPEYLENWEALGFEYDSTLYYAQEGGFRCGTSKSFNPINIKSKKIYKVKEEPVSIMDNTTVALFENVEERLSYTKKMVDRVFKVDGDIVLLWHNHLSEEKNKYLYEETLEYICQLKRSYF